MTTLHLLRLLSTEELQARKKRFEDDIDQILKSDYRHRVLAAAKLQTGLRRINRILAERGIQ